MLTHLYLGGTGSALWGVPCMNFSSLLMIQWGAQSNPRGVRTEPSRHISQDSEDITSSESPPEAHDGKHHNHTGVMVKGANTTTRYRCAGTHISEIVEHLIVLEVK